MTQTFTAHNDLEMKMMAAQDGRLDSNAFMQELMHSQLFMPVEDEPHQIQGFQRSTQAKPLTLQTDDGLSVLVLFTGPDRAKAFLQDFPRHRGGLLTEFSWILERIGSGVGIVINPGLEVGIDLEAEMVEQLIHMNAARTHSSL